MASLLGSVLLSPAAADVTQRLVEITINEGVPFTLDVTDPSVTFPCNEGDNIAATATDVNITGTSLKSPAFSTVAAPDVILPPPPVVPDAPTILGMTFVPAP